MAETTTNTSQPQEEATQSIPNPCPICGTFMYQGMADGILCWICPDPTCGYYYPVNSI